MYNPLDTDFQLLFSKGFEMLVRVTIALIIFRIGQFIAQKTTKFARAIMRKSNVDKILIGFLSNIILGVLTAVFFLIAVSFLGFNTNSLIAIIGGTSVAIGLALKDEVANIAAGVMIIFFRPFNAGDYVSIHGEEGIVKRISLINTSLLTLNNNEIVVPNRSITGDWLINYTSKKTRRVDIVVGISYDSDIALARKIMLALSHKHPLVLQDPPPRVVVKDLGDFSVDIALFVWTENMDWLEVEFYMRENIKLAFDKYGIEIPLPQQVMHIVQPKKDKKQVKKQEK